MPRRSSSPPWAAPWRTLPSATTIRAWQGAAWPWGGAITVAAVAAQAGLATGAFLP